MAKTHRNCGARRLLQLFFCIAAAHIAVLCASTENTEVPSKTDSSAEGEEIQEREATPKDVKMARREVALALRTIGDELNREYGGDASMSSLGGKLKAAGSDLDEKARLRKAQAATSGVKDVAKEVEQAMSSLFSSIMTGSFGGSAMMDAARQVQRITSGFFGGGGDGKDKDVPAGGEIDEGTDNATAAAVDLVTKAADALAGESSVEGQQVPSEVPVKEEEKADEAAEALEEAAEDAVVDVLGPRGLDGFAAGIAKYKETAV